MGARLATAVLAEQVATVAVLRGMGACKDKLSVREALGTVAGDEFGVVLIHADQEDVVRASLLRTQQALNTAMQDRGWSTTCSMGVAIFHNPPDTINQVLHAADQVLYAAKAGGKHQVLVYPSYYHAQLGRTGTPMNDTDWYLLPDGTHPQARACGGWLRLDTVDGQLAYVLILDGNQRGLWRMVSNEAIDSFSIALLRSDGGQSAGRRIARSIDDQDSRD